MPGETHEAWRLLVMDCCRMRRGNNDDNDDNDDDIAERTVINIHSVERANVH